LEELSLESCTWDGIADLCIASPTLKRLSITQPPCGEININAPRLEYFCYTRFLVRKHVLRSFPLLVNAQIDPEAVNSETSSRSPEQASDSVNLLGALFNVKHLSFHDRLFKALAPADDHLLLKLPTFHNLSDLVVIWSYPSLIDRTLFRLLQISPKLESLALDNEIAARSNEDDSWKLNTVPECPNIVSGLEHFKVLEFNGFCGYPWEILETKLQITTKLLTLPRASSSCSSGYVLLGSCCFIGLSTTCVYGRVEGRLTRLQISCQKRTVAGSVAAVGYLLRNFELESTFKLLVFASAMNLLGS
ncbi:hypothetical protein MKX03_021604, partial [Papaver bracteatum]